jgi:beta-lactamase regulating signal transducer with metallopeptidase domain
MEFSSIIIYLIKSSVCFSVLFGFYLIFLKQQRFPNLNRIVLLLTVLVSIAIPFISFSYIIIDERMVQAPPKVEHTIDPISSDLQLLTTQNTQKVSQVSIDDSFKFGTGNIFAIVYFAVAGFFLVRFFWSLLIFLFELRRYSKSEIINGRKIVVSNKWNQTFSFFNVIVLSNNDFSSPNSDVIIQHELVHVNQLHSLDLLVVEVFMAIQWFNPLVYLLKPAICEVHEFLADGKIVERGTDSFAYQNLILSCVSDSIAPRLSNPFSAKTLKNRLNMLTNSHPKGNAARYFVVLPTIMALVALFSLKVESQIVYISEDEPMLIGTDFNTTSKPIDDIKGISFNEKFLEDKSTHQNENMFEGVVKELIASESMVKSDSVILYKRLKSVVGDDKTKLITVYQTKESKEIFRSFHIGENTPFFIVSITKNTPQPIIELISEESNTVIKPVKSDGSKDYSLFEYLIVASGNYRMRIVNSEAINDYLYCIAIPAMEDGNVDFALNVRGKKVVLKSKDRKSIANISLYHKKGDTLLFSAGKKGDSTLIETDIERLKYIETQMTEGKISMSYRNGKKGEPDYFGAEIKTKSPQAIDNNYVPNLHDSNFSRMYSDDKWPISYIRENLVYPKSYSPKRRKLDLVEVEFNLSEIGAISSVKVVKGVNPEVDAEVVRVVSEMPGWQPEKPMGTATSAIVTLEFMLVR